MKEYLLLFRGDNTEQAKFSADQLAANMKQWQEWIGNIAQTGNMLGAQPLVNEGKVIRGTKKKLTDGPFMEGKEVLGGYVLIKANTINDAIKISEGCPILQSESGTVEIREIGTMSAM